MFEEVGRNFTCLYIQLNPPNHQVCVGQLVRTTTEGHLWAQNYDRQLDDIFAIQSEIAEKVALESEGVGLRLGKL